MPNLLPEILPAILRLFPLMRELPIIRGVAIPINDVVPMSDEEVARALNPKTKIKDDKHFNDATHLVKCSDVMRCIENKFNDTTLLKEFLVIAAGRLVGNTGTAAQNLADKMATCVREHALRQDTPRTTSPPRQKYHRPSKGHGTGRRNF